MSPSRLLLSAFAWVYSFGANGQVDYQNTSRLSPNDYLLGSHGKRSDPVFDNYKTVDLGVDLGIGADCGRIDIRGTMRAAMSNILDSKYLEDMGQNILAASPMLLACYYSPTWCAILKQSQLRASLLSNLRLDQCKMIDKYTDSRVEDYERERQQCVRKQIAGSSGNFEQAMESCQGNYWKADIADWSGGGGSRTTKQNQLLGSSAKWAGFTGDDAERTVSLAKALVGDTVINEGSVAVDFGPRKKPLTPRNYLSELENKTYGDLCDGLLKKVDNSGGRSANVDQVVGDADLRRISGESDSYLIDRQTVRSLSYLPYKQRALACRKLSDAVAMTVFTMDMSKSLDFMASGVETNPNLPEHRKMEAEHKRKVLKDQIEMTLSLYKNKNEPLNQVLSQINNEGKGYQEAATTRKLETTEAAHINDRTDEIFMDCADGVLCASH